jgi:hypothetical protein
MMQQTYDIVRATSYNIVRQHTTSYVFISTYRIQCRISEMDVRCRMYMTYDIVGSYCIRHRMYIRCRMSTNDIVCQTYDVVRLLEGSPSCFKGTRSPTAQANERCLSYSKSFIFSLAISKTVSETRSLWCSRTLKHGCGCGPQALPPDQPTVQTASESVRELHSTNLGAAS